MTTPAGRPNIDNKFLDVDGKVSHVWYLLLLQLWERSGGVDDDASDLRGQINLVGLKAGSENVEKGDLSPSLVSIPEQGDLTPVTQQITQASLSDLAPV